jgi:putative NADPH-quinone reductase
VRALVVYAHPSEESFCAALRDRAVAGLLDGGHTVDLIDLYASGFDPGTPATGGDGGAEATEADHARRLAAADALVLVHPTWWGGQPAILKGWFDKVLREGVAYRFDRRGCPRSLLRHIRSLVVVTTYGSSRWVNLLEGEPGRRTVRWALRALLGWRARSRWLACYRMDTAGEAERRRFLERVQGQLARL